MSTTLNKETVNQEFFSRFRCPGCGGTLKETDGLLGCQCGKTYPIVDGIPILVDEETSVFDQSDYTERRDTFWKTPPKKSALKRAWHRIIPGVSINPTSAANYVHFERLLMAQAPSPKVLIIGGRQAGQGMENILANPNITFYESDISFGPRTNMISDAHHLPFAAGTFDAVICQAVLEHVLDPFQVVEEMHRVLVENGLVYIETPFMQQVHAGRYDFLRFSHLAHRRLFRKFSEVESGVACGPGMALSWAIEYFIIGFTLSKKWRRFTWPLARFLAWPYKYFDLITSHKDSALDGASGVYFIGRRSNEVLSDRELLKLYRGGF